MSRADGHGGPVPTAVEIDVVQLIADLLVVDRWRLGLSLPTPVRAVTNDQCTDLDQSPGAWFAAGSPVLVLLAVGPEGVTVAEPKVEWDGQTPVLRVRDSTHHEHSDIDGIEGSLQMAAAIRQARFDTCAECHELLPPEHLGGMDDAIVCHGCMTRNHGVVF
jgi:hypothetical protein